MPSGEATWETAATSTRVAEDGAAGRDGLLPEDPTGSATACWPDSAGSWWTSTRTSVPPVRLISALAGRTRSDADGRLNLFAVGDDDQNIYAFAGASVEFIRRFAADYQAQTRYLVENYRSTANIIDVANRLIAGAATRMKTAEPIRINAARAKSAPGGDWQEPDSVVRGRVQILPAGDTPEQQALAAYTELQRLMALGLDLAKTAVIARQWKFLEPLRAACEAAGIAVAMADEEAPPLWRLAKPALLVFLTVGTSRWSRPGHRIVVAGRNGRLGRCCARRVQLCRGHARCGGRPPGFRSAAEWPRHPPPAGRTAAADGAPAKGLEFDHVFVLDGAWETRRHDPTQPQAVLLP